MTSLPYHSLAPRSLQSEVGPGFSIAQPDITVDWSSVTDSHAFMHWIGSCPRPSGIRVYIPPIAHRASMQRLQRSLLSMGCTVTCRTVSPSRL